MGKEIYNLAAIRRQRKHDRRKMRKLRAQAGKLPWRPGMGQEFYLTTSWYRLRYEVLCERGARCECCGATAADGVKIHVDHIRPRSRFPLLELQKSNLQILCETCNLGKSNRDATDWRPAGPLPSPEKSDKRPIVPDREAGIREPKLRAVNGTEIE